MLEKDDMLFFIRKIRHECTNYDKLAAFYSDRKDLRRKLNQVIGSLLMEKITIEEFRAKVTSIERQVDIKHNKKARKNFIKCHRDKLLKTGYYTLTQANAIARHSIKALIKLQDTCEKSIYRSDLYEPDIQKQL